MADQTLREGAVFHEKYQVIRSLAQGGMGAVYEVIHLETNRRRALKVMLPSVLGSEELRNRFRAEARVASGIESEHIVETFDAGIDRASGMPFLVMELLKGQELADVLKSQGAFPPDRALPLIAQVSRTLDKTHAARVVHRDLKPENLFVSTREDGTLHVKILDFGIAKVVAEGQNANQTRSLGTPLYMAPEQFDGSAPISAQTDLFALAHITYTMLVGVPYWAEEMESSPSLYGFLMAMQNPDSEPPTQRAARRRAQLPPGFDAWFARATAKRAQDRFRSGAEQQAALEQVFGGVGRASAPLGFAQGTVAGGPIGYTGQGTPAGGYPPYGQTGGGAAPPGYQTGGGAAPPGYQTGGGAAPPGYQTGGGAHQGHAGGAAPAVTSFAQSGPAPTGPGIPPPPAHTSAKRGGSGLVIGLVVGALVLGGGGAGAWFLTQDDDSAEAPSKKKKKKSADDDAVTSATPDASSTPTSDPVNLDEIKFVKKDPAVGSVSTTESATDFKLTLTQPAAFESSSTDRSSATKTILAADGKKVLKFRIKYGEVVKNENQNGEQKTTVSPVSGKTYIAEHKDGDVVVTDDNYKPVPEAESAVVEKDAATLGKPSPEIVALPDVTLKRGDRADSLADLLRGSLAEGEEENSEFSDVYVTLKDIKLENGVKVGIFDIGFTAKLKQPDFGMTMTLKGTITIREVDGRSTFTTITGPVTMTGANIAGTGTVTTTVKEPQ